jgi:3-dehydroquinate dehydratase-1
MDSAGQSYSTVSIGDVELGVVPRIAVALTDRDVPGRLDQALRWADIVELRIDLFEELDDEHVAAVCKEVKGAAAALLVTVRCQQQGGGAELSNARRLALYETAAQFADALDVELKSPLYREGVAIATQVGATAIASHHDFTETPDAATLRAIADDARASGADIVKIATTANSAADRNRLLDLLRERVDQPMIVIAMGDHGAASRVFFPLCGSLITYGFLGEAVAPGQLSIEELRTELRRYCPELNKD